MSSEGDTYLWHHLQMIRKCFVIHVIVKIATSFEFVECCIHAVPQCKRLFENSFLKLHGLTSLIFWTHFVTETLVLQTPRNWSQRRRNQSPLTRQNTPPPPKARLGRRPRKTKRRRRTRKASERRVLKNGPVQEPPKLLPAATQCRWFLHHREPPPQCRTSMPSGKT